MSDRRAGPKLGETTTRLSLAVRLVDAFTDGRPVGSQRVSIEGVDAEPVRNPSGYHVFRDLAADTVTLVVDGGPRYDDARVEDVEVVDLTAPDHGVDPADPATWPVETVELAPSPTYEFPAGTTLVRGTVRDSSDETVAGATVSVRDAPPEAETDENGGYVLFFGPELSADVSVDGGLVEVDDANPVVEASHPDHGTASETVEVEEGALTVLDLDLP